STPTSSKRARPNTPRPPPAETGTTSGPASTPATRPGRAKRRTRRRMMVRGCSGTAPAGCRRRSEELPFPSGEGPVVGDVEMPIVSIFFGVVIRIYHREHPPAHFHASYQGFEALIVIETGEVLAGSLPKRALRIVQDWGARHREELLANWQRGVDLRPTETIPAADLDDQARRRRAARRRQARADLQRRQPRRVVRRRGDCPRYGVDPAACRTSLLRPRLHRSGRAGVAQWAGAVRLDFAGRVAGGRPAEARRGRGVSGEPLLLHGCPALPRPAPLINGVEHANFFETRATQYSKAATRGNWNDVWASFDARPKAKKGEAANEVRASDCSGFSSEGIAVP